MTLAPLTLALALAVAPPLTRPQALWARDLHALVVSLVEPPAGPNERAEHALWSDIVRLVQCEPLPKLVLDEQPQPHDMLRALLRVEVARRARLGDRARTSDTLWRDILDPGFFRRESPLAAAGDVLRWPVEEERWEGEVTEVTVKPSQCGKKVPPADELAQLTPELVWSAEQQLGEAAAARLRLHLGVRMLAQGMRDEARKAVEKLQPAQLTNVRDRALTELMRVDLGLDPADALTWLARDPVLEPWRLEITVQAAAYLADTGDWDPLLALTAPWEQAELSAQANPRRALLLDLTYRRALALQAKGQEAPLRVLVKRAFPALQAEDAPVADALRDVAMGHLARGTVDAEALGLLKALGPEHAFVRRLGELGSRALSVGNPRAAEAVAVRLMAEKAAAARARGHALRAELALAVGDPERMGSSVNALFAERERPEVGTSERAAMDQVTLDLAQVMVAQSAELTDPRWHALLARTLARMQDVVHSRHGRAFPSLVAALEDRAPPAPARKGQRVQAYYAVGEVRVGPPRVTLPPPPLDIAWPEPFSLLALPGPDGLLAAWVPRPAPVASKTDNAQVKHAP